MSKQNRKVYHHDGEQLTFMKKVHPKAYRLRKEACFCNLCITINPNLFDKNRTQDILRCHIQHEESCL